MTRRTASAAPASIGPEIAAGAGLDFAALMAPFAPFEPQPHLAVAVSGGSDSMALALLAHDWVAERGGRITALTVDHGLRAEAAAEAAQVAAWCRSRGIDHHILCWAGPKPRSGFQAAARVARYELLEAWCGDHVVLHLLVAHQRDDQAETVAFRAERGSGLDGLAGMAPVLERDAVRLLRPLLGVPRARLRQFLAACSQGWIDDPSNRDAGFARVRVRSDLGKALPGSTAFHLAATGARLGRVRAAREAEDARHLARWLTLDPAGFAWLDPDAFTAPEALGMTALGAVLAMVSGSDHPPRRARLEQLYHALVAGRTPDRTLGGCLVLRRRGRVLICREPAAVAPPMVLAPGGRARWDGRFEVALAATAPARLGIGPLGPDSASIARTSPALLARIPPAARVALPAFRDAKGVVAVPSLGYFGERGEEALKTACRVQFRPRRSLTAAGFTIV